MTKINRTAALTALALAAIPAALLAQPAPGPQASVTRADAQAQLGRAWACRLDTATCPNSTVICRQRVP